LDPPVSTPSENAPYVYAATDIRPRQAKEIELCAQAAEFDWKYTGGFALGTVAAVWANIDQLKHSPVPGIRLIGPGLVGFGWGGLLSGGYLSLPKCDPNWAWGPPPEGDRRQVWPVALVIATLSAITAPAIDWIFLGPIRVDWAVSERTGRVITASLAGAAGALFPYLVPPKTWRAAKEIERMRVEGLPGGAMASYTLRF
jgi:hypothetical protein